MATKFPDNSMNVNLCHPLSLTLHHSGGRSSNTMTCFYRFIAVRVNSFFTHLCYFISLSFLGYSLLKSLNSKPAATAPRNIDFFFTAVSSATVSSMSAVEMEAFSNSQLLLMTFLMFAGGEVFVSLLSLIITTIQHQPWKTAAHPTSSSPRQLESADHHDQQKPVVQLELQSNKFLCYIVLGYLVSMHVLGVSALWLYLALQKGVRNILSEKGLKSFTFSFFTVVSTFANAGFVPTNENMIVFRKMSGMLLILIPQVLTGNTMFPPCMWMLVWAAGKLFPKKYGECSRYLLRSDDDDKRCRGILMSGRNTGYLAGTVVGLFAVQLVMICGFDWDSQGMRGMNSFEKLVGGSFMSVNSRHAGESIVDFSTLSPAVLVVFLVMMYLSSSTSFIPVVGNEDEDKDEENCSSQNKRTVTGAGKISKSNYVILENVLLSQLSLLVCFIVIVCIIERQNMKNDPLNFNVFNIALEVVSAYGNVGFSMGYSCKRQINPVENCEDKWYSFCGKWSVGGKIVLILVMVFGRLKKFNINRGKAWKLL
ncbi:Sodium transporter HKT1 [Linum grandiflorum]